jgi:hypothetical protein
MVHGLTRIGVHLEEVDVSGMPIDARQEHATSAFEGKFDEGSGVELLAHRCVDGYPLALAEVKCAIDIARDETSRMGTLLRGKSPAPGA